jgi:hypothetical protein
MHLPFRWAVSTFNNKLYLDDFKPIEKFKAMDEIADIQDCLVKHKVKGVSFSQWLKEFRNADSVLLWNKDDPKPAYSYWFHRIFMLPFRKIGRKLGMKI